MISTQMRNWASIALLCGPLTIACGVQAQPLRDPTVPPTQTSVAPGAPAQSPLGAEGTSVIVREGKAGLVQGTRIVFPGQKWGRWTVERITETEVWLRDGKLLQKLPRFNGIQRTDSALRAAACAVRGAASAPASAHKSKKTNHPLTSTPVDTQCDASHTRSSKP